MKKDCPHLENRRYMCHKEGHISKECPLNEGKTSIWRAQSRRE